MAVNSRIGYPEVRGPSIFLDKSRRGSLPLPNIYRKIEKHLLSGYPILELTAKIHPYLRTRVTVFQELLRLMLYIFEIKLKCEGFEPRSHFKSRLSVIVWVNVVMNRTVVVASD